MSEFPFGLESFGPELMTEGLTAERQISSFQFQISSFKCSIPEPRIECISQPVSEQVKAQNSKQDGTSGERRRPANVSAHRTGSFPHLPRNCARTDCHYITKPPEACKERMDLTDESNTKAVEMGGDVW